MRLQWLVIALVSLLILNTGFAADVERSTSLSANTAWSFNVNLDSTTDKALVYLNDLLIVKAYMNDGKIVSIETASSQVIKAYNATDTKLTVAMVGLNAGSYLIKVESFDNGLLQNTATADFLVFNPLTEQFKAEVNQEMEKLRQLNAQLEEKIKNFENSTASINKAVEDMKSNVTQLEGLIKDKQASIDSLNSTLQNISKNVELLELEAKKFTSTDEKTNENISEITNNLGAIKQDLNVQQEKLNELSKPAWGGLVTGASGIITPFWLGLIGSVLVAIALILMVAQRAQGTGRKGDTLFARDEPADLGDSKIEQAIEEHSNRGIWAYREKKPEGKTLGKGSTILGFLRGK